MRSPCVSSLDAPGLPSTGGRYALRKNMLEWRIPPAKGRMPLGPISAQALERTACSQVAEAAEFSAPALRVPMASLARIVCRHDDDVRDAQADVVGAARAVVELRRRHGSDLHAGDERPDRRVGA